MTCWLTTDMWLSTLFVTCTSWFVPVIRWTSFFASEFCRKTQSKSERFDSKRKVRPSMFAHKSISTLLPPRCGAPSKTSLGCSSALCLCLLLVRISKTVSSNIKPSELTRFRKASCSSLSSCQLEMLLELVCELPVIYLPYSKK